MVVPRKLVTPWLPRYFCMARTYLSLPSMPSQKSEPAAPWMWMSTKPGVTYLPAASSSSSPWRVPAGATFTMRSPASSTSAGMNRPLE